MGDDFDPWTKTGSLVNDELAVTFEILPKYVAYPRKKNSTSL